MLAQAADRRQFIWVAVDESGTIVGLVSGGPPQEKFKGYTSELYAIYLIRSVQGQGIGHQLLERLAQDLWADGHRTMTVGILAENPGRLFDERLGAKLLKEYSIARGGKELLERYYGWDDLSVLLP